MQSNGRTLHWMLLGWVAGFGSTLVGMLFGIAMLRQPAIAAAGGKCEKIGRDYRLQLACVYADAWDRGADALEDDRPLAAALAEVSKACEAGRIDLFDRAISPELEKIVAPTQIDADMTREQRVEMAAAWRKIAAGLRD